MHEKYFIKSKMPFNQSYFSERLHKTKSIAISTFHPFGASKHWMVPRKKGNDYKYFRAYCNTNYDVREAQT